MASSVLVVDDDPNLVRMMSKFLTREGFAPVPAANGAEALTYWGDPDLAGIPIVVRRLCEISRQAP